MSAEQGPGCFTLTIPSELRALRLVRDFVKGLCELAGLAEQPSYEAVLAVHEACANVICHGHDQKAEVPVTLTARLGDDGLEFRLLDRAGPFDLGAVPELDPTELRRGGRGVFLIRQFMDAVTTSPRPEGGNELRMLKRRPAAAAGR